MSLQNLHNLAFQRFFTCIRFFNNFLSSLFENGNWLDYVLLLKIFMKKTILHNELETKYQQKVTRLSSKQDQDQRPGMKIQTNTKPRPIVGLDFGQDLGLGQCLVKIQGLEHKVYQSSALFSDSILKSNIYSFFIFRIFTSFRSFSSKTLPSGSINSSHKFSREKKA